VALSEEFPFTMAAAPLEAVSPDVAAPDPSYPEWSQEAWEPAAQKYGFARLLALRDAMMPIEKPPEMVHFKFLICSGLAGGDSPESPEPEPRKDSSRKGAKGGGKGGKGKGATGGRVIQDMGRTEIMMGTQRGQWWRNCTATPTLDVVVREFFSLQSNEIWKVPPGHYVQQAGPAEVFVSGPASGLQRMPVLPRGWATVDASSVGGPAYLEPVAFPRWKVVFQSGSSKGDIVVREGLSLESEETAVLLYGARVDQSGPQEVLGDGIVRMPITFMELMRDPTNASAPKTRPASGWVTCDATSQGGPKFFEHCADEDPQPKTQPAQSPAQEAFDGPLAAGAGQSNWDKNRTWKVVNLTAENRKVPITVRASPFAPWSEKEPPEDDLVKWLVDGDTVEQIGHSKKVRGYMIMPVRLAGDPAITGWVTRRVVDRTRDSPEENWMVEMDGNGEAERERRKPRRRQE